MKNILADRQPRYFAEDGAGPPLIVIHGSMSSHRQWQSLADRLRDRHRLIVPDLLMCDPESKKLGAFTFEEDCAFITALIDAHPAAHLLGHSYGGVIARISGGHSPAGAGARARGAWRRRASRAQFH
jgi:pimeloyl-ACP methyl ester carboxylesterase